MCSCTPWRNKLNRTIHIAWHTVQDQLRRKSFYVLLAVAVLIVFSLRGCYDTSYMVNNQPIESAAVAWHASLFAFHLIAFAMLIMAVLISMSVFSKDHKDGTMVLYLSRPVARREYVLGRITGLWLLISVFMQVLHGAVFLIAWQKTGALLPGYLVASLICCLNLFFVIVLTALLSLFMPGFVTALASMAIIFFGFVSDGGARLLSSPMVQTVFNNAVPTEPAWWRLLYPKLAMVQHYAVTIISRENFQAIGPVHPFVNVLIFCAGIIALLLVVFDRREI
jgi:ABC-type transport system involved in multi-copper enzyme maturation permease subunit